MNTKEEKIYPPCEHMKPTLNNAADGKIGPFTKVLLLLHLIHCPGCRRFLDNLKQLIQNLRQQRDEEKDSEALSRLRDVIEKTGENR